MLQSSSRLVRADDPVGTQFVIQSTFAGSEALGDLAPCGPRDSESGFEHPLFNFLERLGVRYATLRDSLPRGVAGLRKEVGPVEPLCEPVCAIQSASPRMYLPT